MNTVTTEYEWLNLCFPLKILRKCKKETWLGIFYKYITKRGIIRCAFQFCTKLTLTRGDN